MKHKTFLSFQLLLFVVVSISLYFTYIPGTELLILLQLFLAGKYYGWKKGFISFLLLLFLSILWLAYVRLNGPSCGGLKGGIFPLTLSCLYILSMLTVQYYSKKVLMCACLFFLLCLAFPISYKRCSPDLFCICEPGFHWLWQDLFNAHKELQFYKT